MTHEMFIKPSQINLVFKVNDYWNYKLRTVDVPAATDGIELGSDDDAADNGSGFVSDNTTESVEPTGWNPNDLQKAWGGYLAVASMVPNVTFLILNGLFGHRFKTQPRLIISLIFVIVMFTFTSIMVQIDTDSWQSTFLSVTLASVVFININAAIFQGGILGVAGGFPPAYMGAVFSGQAVGGIFASGTNVVVKALGANATQSAFFCFVISVVFLLTSLVAYGVASRTQFYQHYLGNPETIFMNYKVLIKKYILLLGEKSSSDSEKKPEFSKLLDNGASAPSVPVKVNPGRVLLQISPYAAAVLICFLVTLGCFPAITMQVESTLPRDNPWAKTFYVPVACFLLFNIGDYLGRFLAGVIQWPKPGKVGSFITLFLSISRYIL